MTPPVVLLDLGQEFRGGQRQVLYLARHLTRWSIPVQLLCPEAPLAKAARAESLCVTTLPARLWQPNLWRTLYRVCTAYPACILHTHDAHSAMAGAVMKTFLPHMTLIHSRRVSYAVRTGWRNWKYQQADAVVGVSADITRSLALAGLDSARLHTIHSGIDPTTYAPALPADHSGPFTFLAIGALTQQKGFAVLLEAAALLEKENLPPWRVRLVGDGPLRESLLETRTNLGLTARVDMPGRLESREALPLAQALIVPSVDGEGSSGTIKEGWATGVPVIASNLASNTELVTDGHSGLLFASGKPVALARAMHSVLLDPELCAKLVYGGTDTLPRFTDLCMAESTLGLYQQLHQQH